MKRKKRLVLLYGGQGEEHEVSLRGAEHILPLVDREQYSVLKIKIEPTGEWYSVDGRGKKTPASLLKRGKRAYASVGDRLLPVDLCLPLLHGRLGEDGTVQGMLELLGIPFVGCDATAGALCFDKGFTKAIAERVGVPVAAGISLECSVPPELAAERVEREVGYPAFVKPRRQGSSVGAALAEGREELIRALAAAAPYSRGGILVEEAIVEKRELELAYLDTGEEEIITPPGEILCRGTYGYSEKYSTPTGTAARANLKGDIAERAREYSLTLAHALGVRTVARFDFFLDGDRLLFNEVNTMPGFTPTSLYAAMLEEWGIGRRELVSILLRSAYAGHS